MANRVKTFKEEHALGMCNETIKGVLGWLPHAGGGARDGSFVGFLLLLLFLVRVTHVVAILLVQRSGRQRLLGSVTSTPTGFRYATGRQSPTLIYPCSFFVQDGKLRTMRLCRAGDRGEGREKRYS